MSEDSDETLADETSAGTEVDDAVDAPEPETSDAASGAAADETADADADADGGAEEPDTAGDETAAAKADRKAKADAAVAERKVVARRTVTSRRVTPKGGPAAAKAAKDTKGAAPVSTSKARDAKKTANVTKAPAPTPQQAYAQGPSPWYVPAIMFGLLIIGALIIMTNYMGVFGDASNIRLVLGLAFILGGIVTATQYR
ncbi:MAG TPA: cell division protein CrgA [Acidimicrobiales bacterium]|nr:cell division protein CrgA [Acidimicrobiales bacterium]